MARKKVDDVVSDGVAEGSVEHVDETVEVIVDEEVTELVSPVAKMAVTVEYPGNLRLGNVGDSVALLQKFLQNKGYEIKDQVGVFGVWTAGAVRKESRALGLTSDSMLSPSVWANLV
jgi:peptidoglycan hydrolase-like protein with peptidoglycan-binding domain